MNERDKIGIRFVGSNYLPWEVFVTKGRPSTEGTQAVEVLARTKTHELAMVFSAALTPTNAADAAPGEKGAQG